MPHSSGDRQVPAMLTTTANLKAEVVSITEAALGRPAGTGNKNRK